VDEIDPPIDDAGGHVLDAGEAFGPSDADWTFNEKEVARFYSGHISGARRLSNGNTLVCVGESGTVFEVTEDGAEVWRFVNPVRLRHPGPAGDPGGRAGNPPPGGQMPGPPPDGRSGPRGPQNHLFLAVRYATDYAAFEGCELTPSGTIEEHEAKSAPSASERR